MTDAVIRARIDAETKARAEDALKAMGLTMSDAIRLLMVRVAEERRLPFEVRVPNAETRAAMDELAEGRGERFETPDALFEELGL
jgi:DNA-damage-inducible protein J